MNAPDLSRFVPTHTYLGGDDEETQLGLALIDECREYLEDFPWCADVVQSHLGLLVPPVLGVVLFQIVPLRGADPWIWVIGGDLPFAYMEFDDEFTPDIDGALQSYVANMREWVDRVRNGGSLDDVFPVDASPTHDNARLLSTRLDFLEAEVIGHPPSR
jgi:hypothetical protein